MTLIIDGIPQPVVLTQADIDVIGEIYVKATYFEVVGSGTTSGTVPKPAGGGADVSFVMDEWGTATDALVTTMDGGKPTYQSPVDGGGAPITTTFDTAGNFVFSATPVPAATHAVIFVYKCFLKNFNADESIFETEIGAGGDHGLLTGLGDDDHPQYHTDGRADTWFTSKDLNDLGTKNHADLDLLGADDHPQYHTDGRADTWFTGKDLADLGTKNHADLDLLGADDHSQYLLLAGRAGGQSAIGGTGASEILSLQGTSNANKGIVQIRSPIQSLADFALVPTAYLFQWAGTVPSSGAAVLGMINSSPTVSIDAATFIYAGFYETGIYYQDVPAGFAVQTLFLAQPRYTTRTAGIAPPQNFLIASQQQMINESVGAIPAIPLSIGLGFSPLLKTTSSGDTISVTNMIGLNVAPIWSSGGGHVISFGTITGMKLVAPSKGLFFPGGGSISMVAYYGVDFPAMGFGGNIPKEVIRSGLAPASNAYFLRNYGGAQSSFGNGHLLQCGYVQCLSDAFGLSLGAAGGDVIIRWDGTSLEFDPLVGDDIWWQFGSGNHTLRSAQFGSGSELRIGFEKFAFGQTGAIGNQVGIFVAPTRTTQIGGGWSDFLLTQAGNITVNHAMSQLAGWTINAPSITLGTGSVTDAVGLLVGGNPGSATNRYGVYILSNPSGGGGENHSLRVVGSVLLGDDLIFESEGSGLLFGEIWVEDNAVATAIGIAGTWYQVTVFDTNGLSNGATPDHTNDHITVLREGKYFISLSASILSGAGGGGVYECEVRANNGAKTFPNIHWDRQLAGGGGDVGSTSASGIADLAANDTVEVWVQNKTGTTDIVFEDINLTVIQVGGT